MKQITAVLTAAVIALSLTFTSCRKSHYYQCHCWYYDNQQDSFLWENRFVVESDYDAQSGYDATALCYAAYGGAGGMNGSSIGCYDATPMDRKAAKAQLEKERGE